LNTRTLFELNEARNSKTAVPSRKEQGTHIRLAADAAHCLISPQQSDQLQNEDHLDSSAPQTALSCAPDTPSGEGNIVNSVIANNNGDESIDVRDYLSLDKDGQVEVSNPTNSLYFWHNPDFPESRQNQKVPTTYASAILTANAALGRQKEQSNRRIWLKRGDIEGVPAELALHLLDIYWSRYHFFFLTYRPAFMRDMMSGGPYYSKLLFFAIMAVSARYSERLEVGGGNNSVDSGREFYDKALQLLVDDMHKSTIPTAVALLLMGNALVSAGEVDRGWLYTGKSIPKNNYLLTP
jgi:hypothetical protein